MGTIGRDVKLITKGVLEVPYQGFNIVKNVASAGVGVAGLIFGVAEIVTLPFRYLIGLIGGSKEEKVLLSGGNEYSSSLIHSSFNSEPVVVSMSKTNSHPLH